MSNFKTREEWLNAAVDKLKPMFAELKVSLPEKIHVITSFPDRRSPHNIQGMCFHPNYSKDKGTYITISPNQGKGDEGDVLETLLHELIHAANFFVKKKGHGKCFRDIALKLGFDDPMRSTPATKPLKEKLAIIAKELGEFPHVAMIQPPKKNKHLVNGGAVRLFDLSIPGYKCYVFKNWLKEYGAPLSVRTKKPLTLQDGSPVSDLFDEEGDEE